MKKRIFAFLGCLVVLVAALAVPVFAETDSSNNVVITSSSALGQSQSGIFFSAEGTLIVSGAINSSQDGTYTGKIVVESYGGDWQIQVEDQITFDIIFTMYESYGIEFQDGQTVLTFQYLTEDIDRFNYPEATNAGFTLNGIGGDTGGGFTQEDLDEAYQSGFTAGQDSIYDQLTVTGRSVWYYATCVAKYYFDVPNGDGTSTRYDNQTYTFTDLTDYVRASTTYPGEYYVDFSWLRDAILNYVQQTYPDVTSSRLHMDFQESFTFVWPVIARWSYFSRLDTYQGIKHNGDAGIILWSGYVTNGSLIVDTGLLSNYLGSDGLYWTYPTGFRDYTQFLITSLTFSYISESAGDVADYDPVTSAVIYDDAYTAGYADGFRKGSSEATDQSLAEAFRTGYSEGYIVGKEEGVGISEDGTFANLFSSVLYAPVAALNGLFDFDILGINMKAFIGSLLVLCIILIIIKKVVL